MFLLNIALENAKVKNNTVIHVFQRPPKVNNETSVITATQITNLSHDENSNIAVPIIATNENSSSSQNGNNLHLSMDHGVDSELNDTRRSAKMLALMLLFISTLNLVCNIVFSFSIIFQLFVFHFDFSFFKHVIVR